MDELRKKLNEVVLISRPKLESSGYSILEIKEINYGVQLSLSKAGSKSIVRIFSNNKGNIRYDYSPINDFLIKSEIANILEGKQEIGNMEVAPVPKGSIQDNDFFPLIGTDESGKGDYFGPLVAAGVFVDLDKKPLLEQIGIKDSKKISDKSIPLLANKIKAICKDRFAVIEISPETYNNLYDKFKEEGKNLNTLLAWGHAKAIEEVLTKVDCDNALSDKFADEKFIISKLQEKGKKITLRQEHKAESNIAVAAASVLARARFLEKLNKLSIEYNIALSKGVSKDVVEQAKVIFNNLGENTLRKIAKIHFKTTESVISQA
ncbi:ribonuclease HIII [Proteiniphilum saccharofermentans]|uniref:Ribonuclease n=1 Tax=Proteiniphilum saccharofermentans TaxID=1642647 RepID=A0A1R3SZE3_9BACT|nr:ribonuclease HIII [Proteiniphilum saccharofermentans]SCD19249.1 ribonuclease HIII [Proteiniphilum saccharofermentans]